MSEEILQSKWLYLVTVDMYASFTNASQNTTFSVNAYLRTPVSELII